RPSGRRACLPCPGTPCPPLRGRGVSAPALAAGSRRRGRSGRWRRRCVCAASLPKSRGIGRGGGGSSLPTLYSWLAMETLALHAHHARLHARFGSVGGREVVLHYGSAQDARPTAEEAAMREGVAM